MPRRSVSAITKYRLTFEQLEVGQYYPTPEEVKAPRAEEKPLIPTTEDFQEWCATDEVTVAGKQVMAGILRAKADELDPPKRGYDA
jgi:hypothetical protein